MLFNTRNKTTGGFKFSVFAYDDQFDPHEVKIHAPISQNLDWWDDTIAHEIRDCLQAQMLPCNHDIRVEVFSPRWIYRRSGSAAYFLILHSSLTHKAA